MGSKSLRECNGYASVMVLGVVVLVAAVLVASGTFIRWHAYSSTLFVEQVEGVLLARNGLAEAIKLLMADLDPKVDWLGEPWSFGLQRDGFTVTIEDEGSKLGINWLDESHWKALFENNISEYGAFFREHKARKELWNDLPAFVTSYPALDGYRSGLTINSLFNLNASHEDVLIRLWKTAGADTMQATMIAREMLEYRSMSPFSHVDDLGKILSLNSELKDVAYPWVTIHGPINVNTAPENVLKVLAHASGLDLAFINQLLYNRQLHPIQDMDQVAGLVDDSSRSKFAEFARWLTVRTTLFQITCIAELDGTQINAIVERTWLPDKNVWMVTICSWIEGGNRDQATYSDD